MKPEELARAIKVLFENFWILRSESPEEYSFFRRHQQELQKEFRQRFGLNLLLKTEYIQLVRRPHTLSAWMGDIGFSLQMDFSLFCCGMAYVEDLEKDTAFMMDELIRSVDLMLPEEVGLDWTNYGHRKSLVRAVLKMTDLHLIERIQGEIEGFEQSEENQNVLFTTTSQARSFLAQAPKPYTEYQSFDEYWQDVQDNRVLEGNQALYQQLLTEPYLQRTEENEETFVRLRTYHHRLKEFVETNTPFHFELYRDYAAFTLEQRDGWSAVFPSRMVVDEILVQLATIFRENPFEPSAYGIVTVTKEEWARLVADLKKNYYEFWSSEFKKMNDEQLRESLLKRGIDWQLFGRAEDAIEIYPPFGRLIAEMREENE